MIPAVVWLTYLVEMESRERWGVASFGALGGPVGPSGVIDGSGMPRAEGGAEQSGQQ
jgi:hypothetical protein